MNFYAHTDGGARGTPGPASIGVIVKQGDKTLQEISEYIGVHTNNFAEYTALIEALCYSINHGADTLVVYCDSELVVKQMRGEYAVREPSLVPLHTKARYLAGTLKEFHIFHVKREFNSEADKLCNMALDAQAS